MSTSSFVDQSLRCYPQIPHSSTPCDLPTPKSTNSFWHSEPSPLLKGHRSTRTLPETADVVVVGSGMTGSSVAHHLLTEAKVGEGLDVVMLEAREACWGATGRNGGHCQPILFEHPTEPEIGHFELRNFRTLQRLIADKQIACEFTEQPGVRAIYSPKHLEITKQKLAAVGASSPELSSMMRLVEDKATLSELRIPTALGAVITSVAGRMWPYKFVARILEDLISSTELSGSFNLQTLTPVEALIPDHSSVLVQTARGLIKAKKVILATNGYSSHLVHEFADLIVPCRGTMSALLPTPSVAGKNRLKTSLGFMDDGTDDYLIQRPSEGGGHLMFGGGRQCSPSLGITDDSTYDTNTTAYLQRRIVETLQIPEQRSLTPTHLWTGIMGYSRDDHPFVGPVPYMPNVYMSAGYTGHGMPNTWLCGKAAALMAAEALAGAMDADAVGVATRAVGLPKSYYLSEERLRAARQHVSVEMTDYHDMLRGWMRLGKDSPN